MPAHTANLFLLQDLEDSGRTRQLADSGLNALRTVADWLKTFVVRPNEHLGRAGPGNSAKGLLLETDAERGRR